MHANNNVAITLYPVIYMIPQDHRAKIKYHSLTYIQIKEQKENIVIIYYYDGVDISLIKCMYC